MGQYTGVFAWGDGSSLTIADHNDRTGAIAIAHCFPNLGAHYPARPLPGHPEQFYLEGCWAYGGGSVDPQGKTSPIKLLNFYKEQGWKTPNGLLLTSIETPPFEFIQIQFPLLGQLASLQPGFLSGQNPADWYKGPEGLFLSSKLAGDCSKDSPLAKYAGIWAVDSYIFLFRLGIPYGNGVPVYVLMLGHNELDLIAGHGNPLQLEPYFMVAYTTAHLGRDGILRMPDVRLQNYFGSVLKKPALDRPIFDTVSISLPNPDSSLFLEDGVIGIGAPNWPIGKTNFAIRRVAGFHEPCPTPPTVGVV